MNRKKKQLREELLDPLDVANKKIEALQQELKAKDFDIGLLRMLLSEKDKQINGKNRIIEALQQELKTKDDQLLAYQVAVNKIDDAFEYAYGDDKARAKIHEILAELTAKLGGTFKADSKDSEKELIKIKKEDYVNLLRCKQFLYQNQHNIAAMIDKLVAENITKED